MCILVAHDDIRATGNSRFLRSVSLADCLVEYNSNNSCSVKVACWTSACFGYEWLPESMAVCLKNHCYCRNHYCVHKDTGEPLICKTQRVTVTSTAYMQGVAQACTGRGWWLWMETYWIIHNLRNRPVFWPFTECKICYQRTAYMSRMTNHCQITCSSSCWQDLLPFPLQHNCILLVYDIGWPKNTRLSVGGI